MRKLSNETVLDRLQAYKYLGFMLDKKLKVTDHVSYTRTKVIPRIKMLSKYHSILNRHTKLILYKTFIVTLFDYANFVYYGLHNVIAIYYNS